MCINYTYLSLYFEKHKGNTSFKQGTKSGECKVMKNVRPVQKPPMEFPGAVTTRKTPLLDWQFGRQELQVGCLCWFNYVSTLKKKYRLMIKWICIKKYIPVPTTTSYPCVFCWMLQKQQPYHTHAHTNPNPSAPRAACITLGFQGQRYLNDIFEKDLRCQAIRHHPNGLQSGVTSQLGDVKHMMDVSS